MLGALDIFSSPENAALMHFRIYQRFKSQQAGRGVK
jgi:hypothetical protein